MKQKFHYPSLDLSFPQKFGSMLKGGGREDYFQNMRRKTEEVHQIVPHSEEAPEEGSEGCLPSAHS